MQVVRADELHQQATKYCAQLQEYNGRLQSEAQSTSQRLETLQVSTFRPCTGIRIGSSMLRPAH